MAWQLIESAPKDGSVVRVKIGGGDKIGLLWSFRARWSGDKWHADFGTAGNEDWKSFEPQPTHWLQKQE